MSDMKLKRETTREHQQAVSFGILPEENVPAWAMIEAGRYQPRRIKGSFRGRELG
jgi:hypothetical protein